MRRLIGIVQLEPEYTHQTGCQGTDSYRAPSRQITPAPVLLGAGGKPSTWLPPGRLVEHNYHPRDAMVNT